MAAAQGSAMAKRPLTIPDRSLITDDTPLRLAAAAEVAFPEGGMTASGLRKERDAGRLVTELVAGREFTTLGDIARMREMCRGKPKASSLRQTGQQYASDEQRSEVAQAALLLTIERVEAADAEKRKAEREARRKEDEAVRAKLSVQARATTKPRRPKT